MEIFTLEMGAERRGRTQQVVCFRNGGDGGCDGGDAGELTICSQPAASLDRTGAGVRELR